MAVRALSTLLRFAFGLLAIAAIVVQIQSLMAADAFRPGRFFAYFTIQSNLLGAAVLIEAVLRRGQVTPLLDGFRGAATVYLIVTFFVVLALLSEVDVQLAVPWVDLVLHKVMPVVLVLDWIQYPPHARIEVSRAIFWLVFPLLWLVFTLLRGAISGWYPYPFLDPAVSGYVGVILSCIAVTAGLVVVGFLVFMTGNVMRLRMARHRSDLR